MTHESMKRLAEAAGLTVRYISPSTKENLVWVASPSEWGTLPAQDGVLRPEDVCTVLEWLAKADYESTVNWSPSQDKYRVFVHSHRQVGVDDSLPAALLAAVDALYGEEEHCPEWVEGDDPCYRKSVRCYIHGCKWPYQPVAAEEAGE